MLNKLFTTFFLAIIAITANADTVDYYAATVAITPTFRYQDATNTTPIIVEAYSPNAQCTFRLHLVGLQQGSTSDVSLFGRVESGQCAGREVRQGIVRASVSRVGDQVVLDRYLEVIVFDGTSGLISNALNDPSRRNVDEYIAAQSAMLNAAALRSNTAN